MQNCEADRPSLRAGRLCSPGATLAQVVWAWVWIAVALVLNGFIFRWLGGFGSAGKAIERWGGHSARRWARRRGMKGF
jgi:hypothetical protein